MFALFRAGQHVCAEGLRNIVEAGPLAKVESDVAAFWAGVQDGPPVLVGAFPFDVSAAPCLYQPETWRRGFGHGPFAGGEGEHRAWSAEDIVARPAPAEYAMMVRKALALIAAGGVRKVVLARSLDIRASAPVDALSVARQLARDPEVATFLAELADPDARFAADGGRAPLTLVGATPELLVSRAGRQLLSHPLAGSARRSADRALSDAAAAALQASEKDRREHDLVVEAILDTLAPWCADLSTPDGTQLYSTATMWHLGTRIEGRLKADSPSAAGLAALLHPTPAVGGWPRQPALDAIQALEPVDRGYYAGAIGWSARNGDGDWFVTLRSAAIRGARLLLHAGAGIVAGSDPDSEVQETAAKFRAMLRALEMDEQTEVPETIL